MCIRDRDSGKNDEDIPHAYRSALSQPASLGAKPEEATSNGVLRESGSTYQTGQDSGGISNRRYISVHGAREHNLKDVDVDIPHRKLTTLTGVSGSGKTSLALDTIYAEGQRRYVESLSAYARQFLGQLEKPKVEKIEGLSPAIAIAVSYTHLRAHEPY